MDADQKATMLARRTTLLAKLGRAEAFMVEYDHERDQMQVDLRLGHLENAWASLDELQAKLEDHETTPEGKAGHEAVRANYETRFFVIKAKLLSKQCLIPQARNPNPPHPTSALSGIKLPTISLPDFDGDYQQWLAFHDTFLALIHANTDVPDIQKFHYLRAAVKGEAAQMIESIPISAANYPVAWQALVNRYSNDYLLKKRHLQALFDIPGMKKETAAALHCLVDEFQRHLKVLQQLQEPTAAWSTILEHLLCTRLHGDTLKAWEDYASTIEDPNYTCLIEFLQRRTRVLESISVNHHHASGSSATTSHQSGTSSLRLSSYASTTSSGSHSRDECAACGQAHFIGGCTEFRGISIEERMQIVNTKRLCFNCLGFHLARNCRSESSCRTCNQRHHTLLHPEETQDAATNSHSVVSMIALEGISGHKSRQFQIRKRNPIVRPERVKGRSKLSQFTSQSKPSSSPSNFQPHTRFFAECNRRKLQHGGGYSMPFQRTTHERFARPRQTPQPDPSSKPSAAAAGEARICWRSCCRWFQWSEKYHPGRHQHSSNPVAV